MGVDPESSGAEAGAVALFDADPSRSYLEVRRATHPFGTASAL